MNERHEIATYVVCSICGMPLLASKYSVCGHIVRPEMESFE